MTEVLNDWLIVDEDSAYNVRVNDATREHAESVLMNLRQSPDTPKNLVLLERVTVEPTPEEPERRSIFRRLFS